MVERGNSTKNRVTAGWMTFDC